MNVIKHHYNTVSTILFIVWILIAHLFSADQYDWKKNTISDLGAQGYDRKLIMQVGFLAFGLSLSIGILLNDLTWRTSPILVYAFSVALTGIFCTKPFTDMSPSYSTLQANLHSIFAQIAGIAFSIGILMQILYENNAKTKMIHGLFILLVVLFSVLFKSFSEIGGIFQRLLYTTSFIWLIKYYKI
jgi:hypothetical membrane protein